jgi:hypothetical protein
MLVKDPLFSGTEYENIYLLPDFKPLNINTLLITATIRNGSGFGILFTIL